jgi:hypothetical protein
LNTLPRRGGKETATLEKMRHRRPTTAPETGTTSCAGALLEHRATVRRHRNRHAGKNASPPTSNRARNRHNKLCLGRCLNTVPRCGGIESATLEKCVTASRTWHHTCSANFLFCLITTPLVNTLYMRLRCRFALVKREKPEKSTKKRKMRSFETGSTGSDKEILNRLSLNA